jgi:hypothetical protein
MCECPYTDVCCLQLKGERYCSESLGLHPLSVPLLTRYGFHHGFGTGINDLGFENRSGALAEVARVISVYFGRGIKPSPRRTDSNVIYKSQSQGIVLTIRDDDHPSSFLGPLEGSYDLKIKQPGKSLSMHLSYKRR